MVFFRTGFPYLAFLVSASLAAPHFGDTLSLSQPDGTSVKVRCYGDEFYHRVESLDGYTLTQDPKTLWIQYARLSADGKDFQSTGVNYLGKQGGPSAAPGARGLSAAISKHQELDKETRRSLAQANRSLLSIKGGRSRSMSQGAESLAAPASAAAPNTGNIVGLTLLIDFPDRPATVPAAEIGNFLNQTGYTGAGNNGSVKDYFQDVSAGRLTYTNTVAAYYTASHDVAYYADPSINFTQRAQELILEALVHLEAAGFDFSSLSQDENGNIRAINAYYAGDVPNAWTQGLWPHMSGMHGAFSADGVQAGYYQISNIGSSLILATFCHENGHMLFGWPDLYDYGFETSGLGYYDLMSHNGDLRNPFPPNPYFRSLAGWETVTDLPIGGPAASYTAVANSNRSFRYTNPALTTESFFIESRLRNGRSASLPDEGLLIWHIDAAGNNSWEQMTPESHFLVSLEQADGRFGLERNVDAGGSGDAFRGGYMNEFTDRTLPDSKWWNGDGSGLNVVDIGPLGSSMTFKVQPSPFSDSDIGTPAMAGSYSLSGGAATVKGGGAGIGGVTDQFFFHSAALQGDGEVVARVESLQAGNTSAKAGIMIRENSAANSRNALICITPGNTILFQYRPIATGSSISVSVAGAPARWVKLQRIGARVIGYHSADAIDWIELGRAALDMGPNSFAGLAVTAHENAALATATFTGFRVTRFPWDAMDVGTPALAGTYSVNTSDTANPVYTVLGGGADIAGGTDNFYFLRQYSSGDVRITARVSSLQNTHASAKAGVMIRDNFGEVSANALMAVTPGSGAVFQRRLVESDPTLSTSVPGLAAPRWVRLERRGRLLRGLQSPDGIAWTLVGEDSARRPQISAGLAVTSHDDSRLASAVFDRIEIRNGFPEMMALAYFFLDWTPIGDGNGEINAGEDVFVRVTPNNNGPVTARGVTLSLTTSDPCFTVLTPPVALGDIGPLAIGGFRDLSLRVSSTCPDGHVGVLNAVFADSDGDSWTSPLTTTVTARSSKVFGTVKALSGAALGYQTSVECYTADFKGQSVYTLADGSYQITGLAPGDYTCTATSPGYTQAKVPVLLPPDRQVDFVLKSPRIGLDKTSITETLSAGQARSVPVKISNTGSGPLQFALSNIGRGYAWHSSDNAGGPVYAWTDIKATGTRLAFNGGMSGAVAPVNLSFPFPYYGANHTSLVATRFGYIGMNDHYPMLYNGRLPINSFSAVIAGFWDELDPGTGGVWFKDFGDRAVFQYDAVQRNQGVGGPYTFQIVLYRTGVIRFFYNSMNVVDGATVGIQNPDGSQGFTIIHEAPFIRNAQAVEILPLAREWLSATPASGTVAAGASTTVNVLLDASPLPNSRFTGAVFIDHDAPAQGKIHLPVSLAVSAPPGGVRREIWNNISGILVSDLTSNPAYPRNPGAVETRPTFEAPQNLGTNFGDRMLAYLTPPTTGDYTFWIAGDDGCELRLSTDEHPGRAVAIARAATYTGFRQWTRFPEQKSGLIRLTAGKKYYIEALRKEGSGGDHLSVGWQGPGITGESERPIPGTRLVPADPTAWTSADIGSPGQAGTTRMVSATALTVEGGGADIWGTSDQFRFVYKPLTGNGQLVARVASLENTDSWAKGGVMFRESLLPASRHASAFTSATAGLAFQRRAATGGASTSTGASGGAPRWMKVVRSGNLFSAYHSTNGTIWTLMGSETIAMPGAIWVGLAVTAHNNATLATAVFDGIAGP